MYGLELLEELDGKFACNITWTGQPEGPTSEYLRAVRTFRTQSGSWSEMGGEASFYTSAGARTNMKNHLNHMAATLENPVSVLLFGWCWDMTWHNNPRGGMDPEYFVHWAGSSEGGPQGDSAWGLDREDSILTNNSVCMQTYLDAVIEYGVSSPSTESVFSTGPADNLTANENGYQRHLKHEFIREFVRADSRRILFDYADILSYNDEGVQYIDQQGWTDFNGVKHVYPTVHSDNKAEYDGGHGSCHVSQAGCLRVAKALWWMLARTAGWEGDSTVTTTYNLSVGSNGNGTVSPNGTVAVDSGTAFSISAVPAANHRFTKWTVSEGEALIASATSSSTTITLFYGDAEISAEFAPATYRLTMSSDENGSVTPSGTVEVTSGSPTSISATPDEGFVFSVWRVTTGSATVTDSTSASTSVVLASGDAAIRAIFVPSTLQLAVSADENGSVTPSGTVDVTSGSPISISAAPDEGFVFSVWRVTTGSATVTDSTSASTSVVLASGDAAIRAIFVPSTLQLAVSADENGSVTPSGTVDVTSGSPISISATPDEGFVFSVWRVASGSAVFADSTDPSTTVILRSGNAGIKAFFTRSSVHLSVTVSGGKNGKVTPADRVSVAEGEPVTISANPDTGFSFYKWSVDSGSAAVDDSTESTTTVVLIGGNAIVTAFFRAITFNLIFSSSDKGSITPSGTITVDYGKPVEIQAEPEDGFSFLKWRVTSGKAFLADSMDASTTITLKDGNVELEALFDAKVAALGPEHRIPAHYDIHYYGGTLFYAIPSVNGSAPVPCRIVAYNLKGQLIGILVDESVYPGIYSKHLDKKNPIGIASGKSMHICRMKSNKYVKTIKIPY